MGTFNVQVSSEDPFCRVASKDILCRTWKSRISDSFSFRKVIKSPLPALAFMVHALNPLGASISRHARTRGVRAHREVTEPPGACRSKTRGGAALLSIGSQAGSPREPPEAPPDVLAVTWQKLARAQGQAGGGAGGGQEGAGAVGYDAFPQHLEAFQRP